MKVCYDNGFLEDFLHEQIDLMTPKSKDVTRATTQNADGFQRFLRKQRVPDIIYRQYEPADT